MTATVPTLDRSTSTAATTLAAVGAAGVCVAFAGLQVALAAGGAMHGSPLPWSERCTPVQHRFSSVRG